MKIAISSFCWECFAKTDQSKEAYDELEKKLNSKVDYEVELDNENIHLFICSEGHKSYTQLQEQKFQILFDLASMALNDGYTKEAVSSYSGALERFIEYYILVNSLKNSVTLEDFTKIWKQMSNQSERQLGAYFIIRLQEGNPTNWDEKKSSFRNNVIHKGYIPSSDEAIEYGQYVLTFIRTSLKELNDTSKEFLEKATFIHLSKNGEKLPKNIRMSTGSIPTIITLRGIESEEYGNKTLKEELDSIRENGFYKHFYRKKI
ncbi:hypothetical protein AX766_13220 [Flavobacterium covae]|uniref:hypothetical protein n=1 Tax=Flavobacterium TaxID=237 RepID=UPI0007C1A45C|nr:hypothetical protein [Flavobacterium covae]AND65275.1 hypothetical protein AX766_13220 [Flavobacterium covae]